MSKRTEIWYRQQLNQLVQYLTGEVEGALAQSNRPFLLDSPQEVFSAERILQVLQKLQKSERLDDFTKQVAQGFIHRGNIQNTHETAENLKRQTGLDLADYLQGNQKVAETVRNASLANVQLIKSIQSQYLDKVQTAVTQAMVKGRLTKDLANEIKKIGNITDNRAKFIARDQSAKLNASLTQARHEEMGITHYRWSTSGDERVRDSHADKDGEIFAYAEPPADTGHPGHDYNCRCVAIPVVDMAEVKQSKVPIFDSEQDKTLQGWLPSKGYAELSDEIGKSAMVTKTMKDYGLTKQEAIAIRAYTSTYHQALNQRLITGTQTGLDEKFVSLVNKGLSKLPVYGLKTYRKVNLPKDALERYQLHSIVTEKHFCSTSIHPRLKDYKNKNVHFIIHGKNGRLVEKISKFPEEKEVLFKTNSKFIIREIKQGKKITTITMFEI